MSFPRYPEYKDSGVQGVGSIPAHWDASRSDKYTDCPIETVTVNELRGREVFHYSIPFVQSTGTGQVEDGDEIDSSKSLVRSPRVLVSKLNPRKGTVCVAVPHPDLLTVCSGEFIPVVPRSSYLRFLHYTVQCEVFRQRLESRVESATRSHQRVNPEDIRKFWWGFPPLDEQEQIARFLDHETAKIDALIQEQQRLIELLKEKRQAVISHAVTKGLDPTVPMKDSGVEWLGEVPEHWGVMPLRYLGDCQNGINIGGDAFGSGFPFVSYGDVYKNPVLPGDVTGLVQSSPEDRQRYSVNTGDVLFTRTSETIDEIGFSSTCLTSIENSTFAGFLIRFRPVAGSLSPHFSKYYFRNQGLRLFFNKEMNLVTRASLSQDLLKLLPITVPPMSEQEEIAGFLDGITKKFTALLEQGLRSIDLLTERRSALISAAVTGKIDVRDWQPPADEHAFDEAAHQTSLEVMS